MLADLSEDEMDEILNEHQKRNTSSFKIIR